MLNTAVRPDLAYNYLNALYYQTRKNRFGGCDKNKLRTHQGIASPNAEAIVSKLVESGWVDETESNVALTQEGWRYVTAERRGKTHASLSFVAAVELPSQREASEFRFDYILRDNTLRQSLRSIVVSIAHDVCREWGLRSFENAVNDPVLVTMLRRFALDYISKRVADGNLGIQEKLRLGSEQLSTGSRIAVENLPDAESWEYELEWCIHSRA